MCTCHCMVSLCCLSMLVRQAAAGRQAGPSQCRLRGKQLPPVTGIAAAAASAGAAATIVTFFNGSKRFSGTCPAATGLPLPRTGPGPSGALLCSLALPMITLMTTCRQVIFTVMLPVPFTVNFGILIARLALIPRIPPAGPPTHPKPLLHCIRGSSQQHVPTWQWC